jgi:hypothetical protein
MTGNKVDGKFLCVFCEDGEKCPNDAMRPAQKEFRKGDQGYEYWIDAMSVRLRGNG